MARVYVLAADTDDSGITKLKVKLNGLGERVIDRAEAISWMRDGHSFVPVSGGATQPAWQLIEVGDPIERYIRSDTATEAADAVGGLPAVG